MSFSIRENISERSEVTKYGNSAFLAPLSPPRGGIDWKYNWSLYTTDIKKLKTRKNKSFFCFVFNFKKVTYEYLKLSLKHIYNLSKDQTKQGHWGRWLIDGSTFIIDMPLLLPAMRKVIKCLIIHILEWFLLYFSLIQGASKKRGPFGNFQGKKPWL